MWSAASRRVITTLPNSVSPVSLRPLEAWAHRSLWGCAAILFSAFLLSLHYQPAGWAPQALAVSLVLLAAVRPFDAALVLAALSPLATVVFVLIRAEPIDLPFERAMVLACLSGWSARRALEARPLAVSTWLQWSAALLVLAACTSAVVGAARTVTEQPDVPRLELLAALLVRDFLTMRVNDVTAAMRFVEGALIVLLVADLCAAVPERRGRVLTMMVIGAAAAASLNVLRIVMVSVSREQSWTVFLEYIRTLRVNIHFADINAAGSYFALMLFLAVGLAYRSRPAAAASTLLITAGLWIAGSRTALVAAFATATFAAISGQWVARRRLAILAVLALLAVGGFAAWKWYPEGRNASSDAALNARIELAQAGLKLAREQPVFGIGFGRFYAESERYADQRENAHNNYIQILAESGVTGLLLFLAVIVFAMRQSWRCANPPSRALLFGIGAFLITCLGGHPLLIGGAAYPFWMALGLAAAPSARQEAVPRAVRAVAAAAAIAFVVTLPFRAAAAVREADVEHASSGFSKWQRAEDGSRYRWAGGRSTFFITSSARAVRIPLRRGPDAPPSIEVRIFLDGREADRALLNEGEDWRLVRLAFMRQVEARFARIDLQVVTPRTLSPLQTGATETSGVLMVGRPVIEE